jgi:hypothetical protein
VEPSPPTAAPARRRYRRRRPGEPVSPQWSSGSQPCPVTSPLSGVLGETWQEYRRHAARLLPLATAGVGVAVAGTELVRLVAARFNPLVALLLVLPAAWLMVKLVVFLVGAVAAGAIHETRSPDGAPPARLRECLGEVTAAWLAPGPRWAAAGS